MKFKRGLIALVLIIASFSIFSSCDLIGGLFNPLIGEWEYSYSSGSDSFTETFIFHADGSLESTFSGTGFFSAYGTRVEGSWEADDDTISITEERYWNSDGEEIQLDENTYDAGYTLNEEKDVLTLTIEGGGHQLRKTVGLNS